MKILIAGGAGFLGSNLTNRLLSKKHKVIVLDNYITGKKSNLNSALKIFSKQLTILEQDITIPFSTPLVDVVVNMACIASPPTYQKYPIETLRTCSIGTENLLRLTRKYNARFLQASTSEVYGNPLVHPQKESYWGNVNSYGSRSMYDEGKRYAEALIWSYRKIYQLNTGIIRIFNTYGPYMSQEDGRVITNFLHQALENKPLTIYGDGKQTRSFCFVDDQIDAWIKMIDSSIEGPINIGNPQEFTILELAATVEKIIGKKLKIEFMDKAADDPVQRRPDISLAQELLDWKPKISLEEGLQKMLLWLKARKN